MLNDSRRYRGKTRINSQSSSKRIFDSFSHKLHHWFSFLHFLCAIVVAFALVSSSADVFFARVLETQIVDSWGEKEKEVHETEILVSVASFCKCWKSSSIKHAGCRKDLGFSIKIMRKFEIG